MRELMEQATLPGVDVSEAINAYREVIKQFPGFVRGRLDLASLLLESGALGEARAQYEAVGDEWPDEPGAAAGLATVLSAEGNHSEAEAMASESLRRGYSWTPLLGVIAKSREHRGDPDGAAAAYLQGYELSPHSWDYLEAYCRLAGRPFMPPTETPTLVITEEQLRSLIEFIDSRAHQADAAGEMPGCDHTLRFARVWARDKGVDLVDLYQYLNANGGFCDCEVCFNVSNLLDQGEDDCS